MQRVSTCTKTGLSLWLALQLCLPAGLLAAPGDLARVEQLQEQSTLWVLSVGVAEYADTRLNLAHADRDAAKDLATVLPRDAGLSWVSAHKPGEAAPASGIYKFAGEKHGAFSTSLLRSLQGAAADDRGLVWLGNLLTYVFQEVPQLTNSRQHPHGQLDGRDLPLFRTDAAVDRLLGQSVSISTYAQRESLQEDKEQGGSGLTLLWLLLVGAAAAGGSLLTGSSDGGGDPTAPGPSIIPPPPSLPDE